MKSMEDPGSQVGPHWHFPKDEIDRWLSEKGDHSNVVTTMKGQCGDVVETIGIISRREDVYPGGQNSQCFPDSEAP